MLKQTNLEEVKQVAKTLLYTDIIPVEGIECIVQHPYTNHPYVQIDGELHNILKEEEAYEQFISQVSKRIEEINDYLQFAYIVNKPYLFCFLKYTVPHISVEDCSKFLGYTWTNVEYANADANMTTYELKKLFSKCDKKLLMEEDYEQYQKLPDSLVIYRGVTEYNRDNRNALSWTINLETARYFATRFGKESYIWTAKVAKANVFAYFNCRGEAEVIVDYNKIMDFKEEG